MASNLCPDQLCLVNYLITKGYLTLPKSIEIMQRVDRKKYTEMNPYQDRPQRIGQSATISAPHMHARVLELMMPNLSEGSKCLDIGSGSGYLLACMKLAVGVTGIAIGVDINSQLVAASILNISVDQPAVTHAGGIFVIAQDGKYGLQSEAPYDAIHVGAAVSGHPTSLIKQLKTGGVLVIPIENESGNGSQNLTMFKRVNSTECMRYIYEDVRYVRMI